MILSYRFPKNIINKVEEMKNYEKNQTLQF